jgi:hypothetical protein
MIAKKLLSFFVLFSLLVPIALASDSVPSFPYRLSGDVVSEGQLIDGFDLIVETNAGTYKCAIENGAYGKNFMCLVSVSCTGSEEAPTCPEVIFYLNDHEVGRTTQIVPAGKGTLDFDVPAEYLVIVEPEVEQPEPPVEEEQGGSSGGGGGSSVAPRSVSPDYDFNEYDAADYTLVLTTNGAKTFTLDGESKHTLEVNTVGDSIVKLTIKSDPVDVILMVGESKPVDIDGDNEFDIEIGLDQIVSGNAYLSLSKYFPKQAEVDNTLIELDGEEDTEQNDGDTFSISAITSALVTVPAIPAIGSVVVLSVLLVALFAFKKRNTQTVVSELETDEGQWNKNIE